MIEAEDVICTAQDLKKIFRQVLIKQLLFVCLDCIGNLLEMCKTLSKTALMTTYPREYTGNYASKGIHDHQQPGMSD